MIKNVEKVTEIYVLEHENETKKNPRINSNFMDQI